ncbi:MAG: NlpC/P60 family protein [Lentisphaerae bacterium]|nr:NlpC/P60 family protein [Lentisphaerota bacterium]
MDLDAYIGIPFTSRGRDFSGCDCWGLVALFYRYEFGVSLPALLTYRDISDRGGIGRTIAGEKPNWEALNRDTDPLTFGDVIVMNIRARQTHVGIYISRGKILHTLENVGSFIAKLNTSPWFSPGRIEGVYRYA